MRLLVSCDQVFDVLTRGPFPAGHESDEAVELHLRSCHECRQLAEALQPAVALLHEAIAGEPCNTLPEYQGRLFAEHASTPLVRSLPEILAAVEFDRRAGHRPVLRQRPREQGVLISAARFFAGATLAGALAILAWSLGSSLHESMNPQPLAMVPAAGARHQPTAAGVLTLASLKLPNVCFPLEARPSAPPSRERTITHVCCTNCHNASKPDRPAARSIARLQQSCNACHDESHES